MNWLLAQNNNNDKLKTENYQYSLNKCNRNQCPFKMFMISSKIISHKKARKKWLLLKGKTIHWCLTQDDPEVQIIRQILKSRSYSSVLPGLGEVLGKKILKKKTNKI